MHRLILGLTLSVFGATGFAQGGDAAQSAIAKLAQSGELACQPSLPVFCGNLHVSCSGPTSIKTFAFKLSAKGAVGSIEPVFAVDADADAVGADAEAGAAMKAQYQDGPVEWDSAGAYVILRPRQASGYILIAADGRYSFRHYVQGAGMMLIGRCD